MAGKLGNLLFALYMARKLDELDALAEQLANKPLVECPGRGGGSSTFEVRLSLAPVGGLANGRQVSGTDHGD